MRKIIIIIIIITTTTTMRWERTQSLVIDWVTIFTCDENALLH